MNNEPVAWMSQGGDVSRSADYFEEMGFKDLIPLYTHPVKELTMTDDEVMDLWNEQSSHPIDFARAILRKAQE
jgi:hypothetical protein